MRIAVFTDMYKPDINGLTNTVHQQVLALAERGHEIKIICPLYRNKKRKEKIKSISVERFPSIPFWVYPQVRISALRTNSVIKVIRKFKPDIIHIHTPFVIGGKGVICAKKLNIPLVGTYHTLLSEFTTYIAPSRLIKLDKLYEKMGLVKYKKQQIKAGKYKKFSDKIVWSITNKFYNKCKVVITCSNIAKKELIKNNLKVPIKVISGGIDLKKLKSGKKKSRNKKIRLLHVGRSSYEKNINIVLEAMKIILANRKDVYLGIIGSGPALNSLKKHASYLGLNKNVKFWGFVSDEKLHEAYKNSDIFVTASTIETLGLVVIEAMAYGLPVVGVNKYAIPEVVKHNVNGYIVKPYDSKAMAEKILHLINNKDLRVRMGQKSKNLVKEHSLTIATDKLEQTYKNIIGIT